MPKAGFYISIITYSKDNISAAFDENMSSIFSFVPILSLFFCLLTIIVALAPLLLQMLGIKIHKFEKDGNLIQILEGEKLEKHNERLYSSLDIQTSSYIISTVLISCSLASLFNFFAHSFWLLIAVSIISIVYAILAFKYILAYPKSPY